VKPSSAPSLTPERWRQQRQLFEKALPLSSEERRELLERECPDDPELLLQLQRLLAAHEAPGNFLDDPILRLGEAEDAQGSDGAGSGGEGGAETALPGPLGPYQPIRLLGQGGMGSVFLARRVDDSFEQLVAVKLLRPGLGTEDLLRRFRRERQILAHLEHPNIARLLDGGTTDEGQPYLVMEYVDGVPVDTFCDEHDLSIEERLRLLLPVCAAVQAAHRNLVVHRDLKPGNILVTSEGEAKLLDFGIAKLLRPETFPLTVLPTEPGFMPMTPEYASPEQVRGVVITTASDVYSLGAVLYTVLTGAPAHDLATRSPADVVEAVCQVEPLRPSTALREVQGAEGEKDARKLEGDLDHILLMALRKEAERRYPSVEALALDLEAYLEGLPVRARGDGFAYLAGKFLRRRRFEVASAAIALAGLGAFTVLLLVQQERLIQERDLARSTSALLGDLFRLPDPARALGETVTARQILDRKADELDRDLEGPTVVRAALRETMGTTYVNLGLYEEGAMHLERALKLRREAGGEKDASVVTTLLKLTDVRNLQGRLAEAEGASREALDLSHRAERGGGELTARSLLRLARQLERAGSLEESETSFEEGLALARKANAREVLAEGLDEYAALLHVRGRREEAVAAYGEALAVRKSLHGDLHPEIASTINNQALLVMEKDPRRALELLEEALEMQIRLYGEESHPMSALTQNNLGLVHAEIGNWEEAEKLYEQARETLGDEPSLSSRLPAILNNLAGLRLVQGDLEEALSLHQEALAQRRRIFGNRHRETAVSLNNLGDLHLMLGNGDEAKAYLLEAQEIMVESLGHHHPRTATVINNLGQVAQQEGDLEGARQYYEESFRILEGTLGTDHPRLAPIALNLGALEESQGEFEAATQHYRRALNLGRQHLGEKHADVSHAAVRLAGILLKKEQTEEAVATAAPACEALSEGASGFDPWLSACRRILGSSLVALKRYREAEPVLLARYESLRDSRGGEEPATVKAFRALEDLRRQQNSETP